MWILQLELWVLVRGKVWAAWIAEGRGVRRWGDWADDDDRKCCPESFLTAYRSIPDKIKGQNQAIDCSLSSWNSKHSLVKLMIAITVEYSLPPTDHSGWLIYLFIYLFLTQLNLVGMKKKCSHCICLQGLLWKSKLILFLYESLKIFTQGLF